MDYSRFPNLSVDHPTPAQPCPALRGSSLETMPAQDLLDSGTIQASSSDESLLHFILTAGKQSFSCKKEEEAPFWGRGLPVPFWCPDWCLLTRGAHWYCFLPELGPFFLPTAWRLRKQNGSGSV
ncbi:hypothetical protein PVAP13_7KG031572 [Panicum virgatum]|uniref:Uncharacterized protein n=1 Tax=Panicum virgatum TaxID=38727 RepID=A0A8T0QC59_PANVG|nr:hypothetical protein PVAP13_7KG031572 [Panicum virgatum]